MEAKEKEARLRVRKRTLVTVKTRRKVEAKAKRREAVVVAVAAALERGAQIVRAPLRAVALAVVMTRPRKKTQAPAAKVAKGVPVEAKEAPQEVLAAAESLLLGTKMPYCGKSTSGSAPCMCMLMRRERLAETVNAAPKPILRCQEE